MNTSFKYICLLAIILPLFSCSVEELENDAADSGMIEFIARPTSFLNFDVSTKAEVEAEESENRIESAYILLYNSDHALIASEPLNTDDLRYKYDLSGDEVKDGFTACILANVDLPSSFSSPDDLLSTILDYSGYDCLDGPDPMPMFGMATEEDLMGNKVTIELKRLFAKVDVNLELSGVLSDGSLDLSSYTIHNIPTQVTLRENSAIHNEAEVKVDDIGFTVTSDNPYSLTFYLPEYVPEPSTRQTAKPSSPDRPDYPVYITFEGVLNHPRYISSPVRYDVYLGGDNFSDFTFIRNTYYKNELKIQNVKDAISGTDERVAYAHNLADPYGDGSIEAANCYIISQPGYYMLPLVKGNYQDDVNTSGFTYNHATHYISDGNNSISDVRRVNADGKSDPDGDYLAFEYLISSGSVKDGNSVLKYGDWSWHLWFSTEVPADEIYPDGSDVTTPTMMDRNLGAGPDTQIGWDGVATADFHPVAGLYYKYGNKNPFFKSAYQGNGETGSWDSADKTMTDPCPPGYMIPSSGVWTDGLPADELSRYFVDGSFLYSEDFSEGEYVRYPFASYLNDSGTKVTFAPKSDGPNTSGPYADKSGTLQYDFTVKYSGQYDYLFTRLFAADRAIECKYSRYTVNESSLVYSGSFTVSISSILGRKVSITVSVSNLTQAQLKAHKFSVTILGRTFSYSLNDLKLGSTVDSICKEILSSIKNSRNDTMDLTKMDLGTASGQAPKTNGHQIRCQKIEE